MCVCEKCVCVQQLRQAATPFIVSFRTFRMMCADIILMFTKGLHNRIIHIEFISYMQHCVILRADFD